MKALAVGLLAVGLMGCARSGVAVQNGTAAPISAVEVRVAGNQLEIDRIEPGEVRHVGYRTQTEETLGISFDLAGVRRRCTSPAYVSPPFEDEFTIRVMPDGSCEISQEVVGAD